MITVEEAERLGGYSVIYADPAWKYSNRATTGAAEDHYPTMALAEMKRLPVARIAAPTSLLFVWGTWPILADCLELIPAWGFDYKTCAFVWVKRTKTGKLAFGGGNYTRANSEFCLLGTRGRGAQLVKDKAIRQVIEGGGELAADTLETTIARHSAKPEEARNRIVQLVGEDTPRIELFARVRAEGWDSWGNELDADLIMEPISDLPEEPAPV